MQLTLTPTPDDDTAAAIMAAISWVIQQQQAEGLIPPARRPAWRAAAVLAAQGLPPTRDVRRATWSAAERTSREGHWSHGIAGL